MQQKSTPHINRVQRCRSYLDVWKTILFQACGEQTLGTFRIIRLCTTRTRVETRKVRNRQWDTCQQDPKTKLGVCHRRHRRTSSEAVDLQHARSRQTPDTGVSERNVRKKEKYQHTPFWQGASSFSSVTHSVRWEWACRSPSRTYPSVRKDEG